MENGRAREDTVEFREVFIRLPFVCVGVYCVYLLRICPSRPPYLPTSLAFPALRVQGCSPYYLFLMRGPRRNDRDIDFRVLARRKLVKGTPS